MLAAEIDDRTPVTRAQLAFWERLKPAERLPVGEWLDRNRVIGPGYPSPFLGPWRTSRTPYLAEPLEAFIDPDVEILVLLFSSQVGKTEALLGMLLYASANDPGPVMWVMPIDRDVEKFSKDRIAPSLKTCGARISVGSVDKTRSSDNAILHKRVNGHPLILGGSNSPAGLAAVPIRYLFGDELDKWSTSTPAGDAFRLARQRTSAFRRRKITISSTPLIKSASRIEDFYDRSDQRRFWWPCPRCGVFWLPKWAHVKWTSRAPETAHLECPECGAEIADNERSGMVARGEWRASTTGARGIRGYHLWAVVSTWVPLSKLAEEWLEAQGNVSALQQFVNERLGESWELPSERIDSSALISRREEWAPAVEVPAGARILTAGVDTQDDRLEVLVIGWGAGEESWIIHRDVLFGDPAAPAKPGEPSVWDQLDQVLLRQWVREEGGTSQVQCALVDSAGHKTPAVYSAVVVRQHRRVFACIGRDGGQGMDRSLYKDKTFATRQGKIRLFQVDVNATKSEIHDRLKLSESSGPRVMHFPAAEWCGDDFFSQLTAEHRIKKTDTHGRTVVVWMMRPGRTRNEALDMAGYALAAYRVICPTPGAFDALAARLTTTQPQAQQGQQPAPAGTLQQRQRVRRSGYLG